MHRHLWQILRDRRLWKGPAVWVGILLIAINLWVRSYGDWSVAGDQKEAQRRATQQALPTTESTPRYDFSDGEDLERYWQFIPDARRGRLVIVSGMSQMNTIDDPAPGDQLTCEWLDDSLSAKGIRAWGLAASNLCNEEAVFQLISLVSEPATRPSAFIYPLCFDKMRDVDLRPGYERFLRARPAVQQAYVAAAQHYRERCPAAAAKMFQTLEHIQQSSKQADQSFEGRLRSCTEQFLPLVATRKELNIHAQLKLYALRNAILHIKSTHKRPMIQARYEMNWEFLRMMSDLARENGVQIIYYIVPMNPRGDNPYVASEYAAFKERSQKYCTENQIPFANFENVVDAQDWGVHEDGPDFKHFRGPGHKKTAAAILERFSGELANPPAQLSGAAR